MARLDLKGYLEALAATLVTFAALALLILVRYPLKHYVYPIGWDSTYYVWRAAAVTVDGLDRIGTIRAGSPLFVGLLMQITAQNGFTMVPVAMAVLAGVVAVGAAAMARAALGVRAVWIPVIGVMTWLAFGHIGMIGGHLDNVLNAAFVVSGFAAAVAFAGQGRGVVAVALLFMASALAEWPFYLLAMAVFVLGLLIFAWPAVRSRLAGRTEVLGPAGPLAAAVGVSAVFAGLTFLSRPPEGGVGLRFFGAKFRATVRERFFVRLRDTARYYAVPLAAAGAYLAARIPLLPPMRPARRLFLSLMAAWVAVTVAASIAQAADLPVAGARLLNYLFAVPLLAGVFVWALTQILVERHRMAGAVLGAVIVLGAFAGFGFLAWQGEAGRKPWIAPGGVREVAAAGEYAHRFAPGKRLIFLMTTSDQAWRTVQSALAPELVPMAMRFVGGTPAGFAAASGDLQASAVRSGLRGAVGFVLQRYNRVAYDDAAGTPGWTPVAPGVLVLPGVHLDAPLAPAPPKANLRARSLAWILVAVVTVLFVAGSGWAVALLPSDRILRVALAPGLGAALLTLLALVWDRVGMRVSRPSAWVLLAVTTLAGWAAAWWMRDRRPPGQPEAGEPVAAETL